MLPQVALYFNKFAGVCQSVIHEYKLNFLHIICDHDLFVEMPGRDPTERFVLVRLNFSSINEFLQIEIFSGIFRTILTDALISTNLGTHMSLIMYVDLT